MIRIFQPIPVASRELYVFDLDGTMIDSAQDLANSVNATLAELQLGSLPDATIAGFVGNGVPLLLRRSLGRVTGVEPEAVDGSLFDERSGSFCPTTSSTCSTLPSRTQV